MLLFKTNALITNALPPSHPFSHLLLLTRTAYSVETLVSLGQLSCLCPFLTSCSLPVYQPLRVGIWGGESFNAVWTLLSSAPKNWCVINHSLATDTKYSTMRAAVRKVNPISARSDTSTYKKVSILESYWERISPIAAGERGKERERGRESHSHTRGTWLKHCKEWVKNSSHSFGCHPSGKSKLFNFCKKGWSKRAVIATVLMDFFSSQEFVATTT